ncbi:uncharacterized protein STAUR_1074 [Stigmatella aurantiaca DW4/3-1]|nr:uncharacterized protein STAUR_1074 [Stigmatella aurantiaca DW4/3-1]
MGDGQLGARPGAVPPEVDVRVGRHRAGRIHQRRRRGGTRGGDAAPRPGETVHDLLTGAAGAGGAANVLVRVRAVPGRAQGAIGVPAARTGGHINGTRILGARQRPRPRQQHRAQSQPLHDVLHGSHVSLRGNGPGGVRRAHPLFPELPPFRVLPPSRIHPA